MYGHDGQDYPYPEKETLNNKEKRVKSFWHPTKVMTLRSMAQAEGLTVDQMKEAIKQCEGLTDREELMLRMSHVCVPMTRYEVKKKPEWEYKEGF